MSQFLEHVVTLIIENVLICSENLELRILHLQNHHVGHYQGTLVEETLLMKL